MASYHSDFTQSTQMMRLILAKRIHILKFEDQEYIRIIKTSGIEAIPDEDLQDLCRERGMRAVGLTRKRLEQQYTDWIELSGDPKISVSFQLFFYGRCTEGDGKIWKLFLRKSRTLVKP